MTNIFDYLKGKESLKQKAYDYVCGEIDKFIADVRKRDPELADSILEHVKRDPVKKTVMWYDPNQ
jgi:hypothetical protein